MNTKREGDRGRYTPPPTHVCVLAHVCMNIHITERETETEKKQKSHIERKFLLIMSPK